MKNAGHKNLYAAFSFFPYIIDLCLPYSLQDIFNIAPKRPNWDLKREMEKKLAKLERKTQESIHMLISE